MAPLYAPATIPSAGPVLADTFWRQVALNAVSPIITALLGGLVVGFLIQWARSRQGAAAAKKRLEFRHDTNGVQCLLAADRSNPERVLCSTPAKGLPDGFLFPGARCGSMLTSVILLISTKRFRIAARVIEEQLRVSFPDVHVRWLWHGAVDMLSARSFIWLTFLSRIVT